MTAIRPAYAALEPGAGNRAWTAPFLGRAFTGPVSGLRWRWDRDTGIRASQYCGAAAGCRTLFGSRLRLYFF